MRLVAAKKNFHLSEYLLQAYSTLFWSSRRPSGINSRRALGTRVVLFDPSRNARLVERVSARQLDVLRDQLLRTQVALREDYFLKGCRAFRTPAPSADAT